MGPREQLAQLSGERIDLPAGFEIAAEVKAAVGLWPMTLIHRLDWVCSACNQVVIPVHRGKTPFGLDEAYQYNPDEAQGLVLAHLIQRHGWTRETIGER